MSRVRVVVPTTAGPSAVERITAEDPAVSSVVCLSGKALALPISRAYDAFVRDPTGVVQRHFGHAAFRVDVSAPIAEGFSWQLGVLLAHGLAAAGRLAGKDDPADLTVWASGEVDRDLNVLAVDHLAEKLAGVGPDRAGAERLAVYVPEASRSQIPASWRDGGEGAGRVVGVAHVNDLFRELGLEPLAAPSPGNAAARRPRRGFAIGRRIGWVAGGGAVAVALAAVALTTWLSALVRLAETESLAELEAAIEGEAGRDFAGRARAALFERTLAWSRPGPGALKVELVERRPPPGSTCAAVAFGRDRPLVKTLAEAAAGRFETISVEGLCGLHLSVRADASIQLWGVTEEWSGDRRDGPPDSVSAFGPGAGGLENRIEPPRRPALPLRYRTTLFASPRSLASLPGWWRDRLIGAGPRPDSRARAEAIARLERLGILVREVTHELGR